MARATYTINDHSNEVSSFGVTAPELTAGNIVAQLALAATLRTKTAAIIIGALVKEQIAQVPFDTPATPSNYYAQREIKWLVSYRGATTGKLFQLEIACPLQSVNTINGNTDEANVSDTLWTDWISAFEAYASSPDDVAEGVVFVNARLVGRNL